MLVIPAQAGIQPFRPIAEEPDPSFRWDDGLFRGSFARGKPDRPKGFRLQKSRIPAFAGMTAYSEVPSRAGSRIVRQDSGFGGTTGAGALAGGAGG